MPARAGAADRRGKGAVGPHLKTQAWRLMMAVALHVLLCMAAVGGLTGQLQAQSAAADDPASGLAGLTGLASSGVPVGTLAPAEAAWQALAAQAEATLSRGEASDAALSDLRRRIVAARTGFASAQGQNAARITTVQDQLAALGSAAEGEPAELTERRAALTAQLTSLRAPVLRAEEAFTRADGLVREIDLTLRDRQTAALTRLGPSPLWPDRWTPALEALERSMQALRREIMTEWNTPSARARLQAQAPIVLGYLVLALVLVLRGARWGGQIVSLLRLRWGTGTGVWRFLRSVVHFMIPLGGLFALVAAVEAAGLFGLRGALMLETLPWWGGTFLAGYWLARQVFDANGLRGMAPLTGFARTEAIWLMTLLGGLLVASDVLDQVARYDRYSEATRAVLNFPILALAGMALALLGRRLIGMRAEDDPLRGGLVALVGRGAVVIGGLVPLLAAAGYGTAAQAIVFPAALTLALGGAVLVLQEVVHGLYTLVMRRPGDDSLVPVLAGFALFLAALPVLALIWGGRTTDLLEMWDSFVAGVSLGGARLSPGAVLLFAAVFAAGYAITRALQAALRVSVLPRTSLDTGAQTALISGAGYLGIFLAALVAFGAAGLDLSSLAIVAGALSVGIGFGLQNIVSNFVSGIILLVERPIAQGDWIEVGGVHGTVRDISVRSTRIETFDRSDVILPNADLISGRVTNYTRGNVIGRVVVPVGVSFDSDTRQVERLLLGIARQHDMVLMNPAPSVVFMGFGADSMNFEIRAILRDVNSVMSVRSEMNHQIVETFRAAGIEIPFAQRDVTLRTADTLRVAIDPPSSS